MYHLSPLSLTPQIKDTGQARRYRTDFTLRGVPVSDNFIERPLDSAYLEQCLLPREEHRQRRIFVLHGLGGIGKTQLAVYFARRYHTHFSSVFWLDGTSENRLQLSLASCAGRLPEQDRMRIPRGNGNVKVELVVQHVMGWLQRPDNRDWLLIFDNVDQDYDQGGKTCKYNIHDYLPGDHGSILITTRLSKLSQLGEHTLLTEVGTDLARSIFQKWHGKDSFGKFCTTSTEFSTEFVFPSVSCLISCLQVTNSKSS